MSLIVKKYGGMTLSDPEKIKSVARHLAKAHQEGSQIIVVVSAMGKTTDTLIQLAQQVSKNPNMREMDMLLSVGERISMSLLSMALLDLGVPAVSLTGSQAGILTTDDHSNALIQNIQAPRIEKALQENKVVIVAGFQGVSPKTKEITTLGRGGSDTSAVALAAKFKADRCEILKEVPSVFTADPQNLSNAQPLEELTYDSLMEMTFWGAKVLHYRSVELAGLKKVPLWIAPAHPKNHPQSQNESFKPTRILDTNNALLNSQLFKKETSEMYESQKILGINGHKKVFCVQFQNNKFAENFEQWIQALEKNQISAPQILHIDSADPICEVYFTSSNEILTGIESLSSNFKLKSNHLCSITLTSTGNTNPTLLQHALKKLAQKNQSPIKVLFSALSITFIFNENDYQSALQYLHDLV